jgi:hypothetical protein
MLPVERRRFVHQTLKLMSESVARVRGSVIPAMAGSAVFLALQMLLFWYQSRFPRWTTAAGS